MKILSVVGARPNFIKLAPLHKELVKKGHQHIIVHTGQHYDGNMSGNFFKEFKLPEPDYNLSISHSSNAVKLASMLPPIEDILLEEEPDCVIIYGDTTSSLAGALSAAHTHFPVVHIEAGVRNHDIRITENLNRIIIDRIAQLNMCSTNNNYQNLLNENIKNCFVVGDLMLDMFKTIKGKNGGTKYIFLTLHRPENVDGKYTLQSILDRIASTGLDVIWTIHPRTRKTLNQLKRNYDFTLLEPLSYTQTIEYIKGSHIVITDSGGVQKEAYWAKKPCLVMFDELAWPEIHETGNQALVTHDNIDALPELIKGFRGSINHPKLFGDGTAAKNIQIIIEGASFENYFREGF